MHGSITTIFGRNVAEKVGNQNILALPGETENPEIATFRLNAACFLPKNTKHS